jgi:glyoxylate reductase
VSRPTGVQVAAVLVTRGMPEAVHRHLAERCRLEVWEGEGVMPRAELLDRVAGKAGLMAMLTDRVDAELLDRAGPGLRVVANFAVGHDNLDLEACTARGVLATNTPDVVTEATADLAWALLLAAARRVAEGTGSCGPAGPGSGGRSSSSGSRSTARPWA